MSRKCIEKECLVYTFANFPVLFCFSKSEMMSGEGLARNVAK